MSVVSESALSPEAWWDAAAEQKLMLLRCPACASTWLPWMPNCPEHGPTTTPEAIESAGAGTIYSWVGVQSSISSPEDAPFTVLAVMLDEGAMIYGRLVPGEEPAAEAKVSAIFVERGDRTVIDFRLATPSKP